MASLDEGDQTIDPDNYLKIDTWLQDLINSHETHSNPSISSKESSDSESEIPGPWNEFHTKIRAMFYEVQSLGDTVASLNK